MKLFFLLFSTSMLFIAQALSQTVLPSDLKAKIILINMWATWYKPYRTEQQGLSKIYQRKYKLKKSLLVFCSSFNFKVIFKVHLADAALCNNFQLPIR